MLDPSLYWLEQNPLVRAGGWAYAVGISVIFVLGLAALWDWSWKNGRKLAGGPKLKSFMPRFYWLLAGPDARNRWGVVAARALAPASVAMKIVLSINNLIFVYLIHVASVADNTAIKAALGMEDASVWQFQRAVFFWMVGLTALAGLLAIGWTIKRMVSAGAQKKKR